MLVRRCVVAMALFVGVMLPANASAADGIDCVYLNLSAEAKREIARIGIENGDVFPWLLPALDSCTARQRWSADARNMASTIVRSRLQLARLRVTAPVNSATLLRVDDAVLRGVPSERLAAWTAGGINDADTVMLANLLRGAGVPEDQIGWFGRYVGMIAVIETYQRRFAAA